MNALILCPHCNQLLRVLDVGPWQLGTDPARGGQVDRYCILRLEDGFHARMWEHE